MINNMTRLELFDNLGYKKDPLKGHMFETGDVARTKRILTIAVNSRSMVNIVGVRGCGKTEAVKAAIKKMKVKPLWVIRENQEKLTIDDIKTAMIKLLSTEDVKRGGISSSMQLRRIIGEASAKQEIVVIIEEAQRLHPSTLRSLKTLREIEYAGQTELFTIILLAQSNPMSREGVSEVRLRSDLVWMQGLTPHEAAHYVRQAVGRHFEEAAIEQLSEQPAARNYLELQEACVKLLNVALADGREQVSIADVQSLTTPEISPVPRRESRKQAPAAPVSGSAALASVLGRASTSLSQQVRPLSGEVHNA